MVKQPIRIIILTMVLLTLSSCAKLLHEENIDKEKNSLVSFSTTEIQRTDGLKLNPLIFENSLFKKKVDKRITVSDYANAPTYKQIYTLYLYKDLVDFTDFYNVDEIGKKEFTGIDDYKSYNLVYVYESYMLFHVMEKNGKNYVVRYNLNDGSQSIVFEYSGDYQIAINAANDNYIIWQEDENANWLKVSLNCYNIATGKNKKIFTYSRNGITDLMYNWNFNDIILDDANVYFDNTEEMVDNIACVNMYKYNIVNGTLEIIGEKRAAHPLQYKGITWLSFDEKSNEYILKNIDENVPIISVGEKYIDLYASSEILVGYTSNIDRKGIMYFEGVSSVPVLESTGNIDEIYCTDQFITWDGWNNDYPLFYDIKNRKIICMNCLEEGNRYAGYVTDDYLIFGTRKYGTDSHLGQDVAKTKSLLYYYIKIDALREKSATEVHLH